MSGATNIMTSKPDHRQAFTIIELLVVITIILVLAGLLLAVIPAVQENARRSRTSAILALAAQALAAQRASVGGLTSIAEHPLASSRYPTGFVRASDGSAVAPAGLPLVGPDLGRLSDAQLATLLGSSRNRLLQNSDCFADLSAPGFYGTQRELMGVLGPALPEITQHIRLALTTTDQISTSISTVSGSRLPQGTLVMPGRRLDAKLVPIDFIDTAGERQKRGIPDSDPIDPSLSDPTQRRELMRTTVERALGGDQTTSELRILKALLEPPDDDPANLALDNRVWSPASLRSSTTAPGNTASIGHYRLRGLALHDAWGREVLVSTTPEGDIRLLSAGRDGFFALHPGPDLVFATAAQDPLTTGDDRDGRADNIHVGGSLP